MKKIIVFVLTFIISNIAVAEYQLLANEEIKSLIDEKYRILKSDDKCDSLSNLAKIHIKYRQLGIAASSQYDDVDNSNFPDDIKLKEKQIIKQAYEIPIFQSELDRNKIELIFGSNAFLECRKKGMDVDWKLY